MGYIFRALISIILLFSQAVAWGHIPSAVDHPQGLLWHFAESGQGEKAAELESYLSRLLQAGDLKKLSPIRIAPNVSDSYIAEFPGQIFAVLKEADRDISRGPEREVAAYVISRLMGLNIVPLTVVRMIDGKKYSLQLYYPHTDARLQDSRAQDVQAFDILIDNIDRDIENFEAMHNLLVGRDGRVVGIDHSRALTGLSPLVWHRYDVSADFLEGLARLSAANLYKDLQGLLTVDEIRALISRIDILKGYYNIPKNVSTLALPRVSPQGKVFDFKKSVELIDRDFFDALEVTKKLRQAPRDSFEGQDFKLIEKHWRLAIGVILQDWFSYQPPVRAQLLKALWGGHFQVLAKYNNDIVADIRKIDPMKAYRLNPNMAMAAVAKAMAPSAAATIQCSQVFAQ